MLNIVYKIIAFVSASIGILWFFWYLYDKKFPFKRLSWKFAEKKAQEISNLLIEDSFLPTLIVGIGRGGAILGAMISGCLGHRPLLVVDREYKWKVEGREEDMLFSVNIPEMYLKKVLIVSGEIHSGGTMKVYYRYLKLLGAKEIRKAVLFFEDGCPVRVNYIGIRSNKKNILMPWMFSKNYIRADRIPPKVLIKEKNTLTVYLIRHGRTKYDDDDRFCGVSDPDLSEKGIEQAISLGKFFRNKSIETVYSSELKRSIETAKIICALNPETELIITQNLNEINFGKWEGLTREEIKKHFPREYKKWSIDPFNNIPPDGEDPRNILKRMLEFLSNVEKNYELVRDKNIICVTHKTPIRLILSYFENSSNLSEYRKHTIKNGDIIKLLYNGNGWKVERDERNIEQ